MNMGNDWVPTNQVTKNNCALLKIDSCVPLPLLRQYHSRQSDTLSSPSPALPLWSSLLPPIDQLRPPRLY